MQKRLRLHARFDRTLLGKLCFRAWTCIRTEVRCLLGREDVTPGMVAAVQTHGESTRLSLVGPDHRSAQTLSACTPRSHRPANRRQVSRLSIGKGWGIATSLIWLICLFAEESYAFPQQMRRGHRA
jgi:hypothetical protein